MNNSASRITFCVTCVVERMVTTHFLKPEEGKASALSRFTGEDVNDKFSALLRVSIDSNQNKHVILTLLVTRYLRVWFGVVITWAANSPRLPPPILIDGGIWRPGEIASLTEPFLLGAESAVAREATVLTG